MRIANCSSLPSPKLSDLNKIQVSLAGCQAAGKAVYQAHPFNQGCSTWNACLPPSEKPYNRSDGTERESDKSAGIFLLNYVGLLAFLSTSMSSNASKCRQWGRNGENHCRIMTLNSLNQNKKQRCRLPPLSHPLSIPLVSWKIRKDRFEKKGRLHWRATNF